MIITVAFFSIIILGVFAYIMLNQAEKQNKTLLDEKRKMLIKYNDLYNQYELLVKEYNKLRKDLASQSGYKNRR